MTYAVLEQPCADVVAPRPRSLFVYHIQYDNYIYYLKRFLFFKRPCRTNITDVLILYDSKGLPFFERERFAGWAERVRFLDYDDAVRRHVDFAEPGFLDGALAQLAAFCESYRGFSHCYSYSFRFNPLAKMVVETLAVQNSALRVVELEDGFGDYVAAHCPWLYPDRDPYADTPFGKTPYARFFSNRYPRLPRERFDFALFHPEMIERDVSQQVHVGKYFDFPTAVARDHPIIDAVIYDPFNLDDLDRFRAVTERHASALPVGRMATLKAIFFTYREVTITPVAELVRRGGSLGLAPANDLTARLLAWMRARNISTERVTVYDRDPGRAFDVPVRDYLTLNSAQPERLLLLSPNHGHAIRARLLDHGIDDAAIFDVDHRDLEHLDLAESGAEVVAATRNKVTYRLLGDTPMRDLGAYPELVFFDGLLPFEFFPLRDCVYISTLSSVLYRLPQINPAVETIAVPLRGETRYRVWGRERVIDGKTARAFEATLRALGVRIEKE